MSNHKNKLKPEETEKISGGIENPKITLPPKSAVQIAYGVPSPLDHFKVTIEKNKKKEEAPPLVLKDSQDG